MIQNIVFDMGNVLLHFDPDVICEKTGAPPEACAIFRREIFHSVEWARMDRGRMTQAEAWERIRPRLPAHLHEPARKALHGWWDWDFRPVEGMAPLMEELKAAGYGLYLLSNATYHLHDYARRIPACDLLGGMVISADWHVLKPQHEIYEVLYREYNLTPETCFFIDDNFLNIEGALEGGMIGMVFDGDVSKLRKALRGAGVEIAP